MRTVFVLAAAAIWALGGHAQTGLQTGPVAAGPAFEVASIKPDTSGSLGMSMKIEKSGHFLGTGLPLRLILEQAYDVKDSQLIGAPSWLDSDRFTIEAKPDEATAAEMQKLNPDERKDKLMLMLRALLEDRCRLTLSKETRDLPVYALLVGKSGPKLHESAPGPNEKPADTRFRRGELEANNAQLISLANMLSGLLGRPVVDKTGLSGKYDFNLKWAPEEQTGQMFKGAGDATAPAPPPAEPAGPSIFTAVQEQLGLKLEAQKSPMMVLVIDHIEKPSAN
jgi:uncharacterized protein (TIGR03435 family)